MLADIASNETDWADILFLVAIVLGLVAGFMAWPDKTVKDVCGWLAVAAVAFGLLLL